MRFHTSISLILVLSVVGLTYEIAAGRVLAPFFGTSLLTWTAVIATVLAGFALGSAIGGLVAELDRPIATKRVRAALVATAILMALSPTIIGLLYALGARGTGGMLFTVFVAFFPASVLVSIPSPLLARLAVEARPGREGSSLGLVLAAGSLGAIFGAILAGFISLPLIGSSATFAACGAVALVCAAFVRNKKASNEGLILPSAAVGFLALFSGQACQYESGLSCIDIVRHGDSIYLYSDRTLQASEQVSSPDTGCLPPSELAMPYTQWIWTRMEHDLNISPAVLFIGGGGYTLPTKLLSERPSAQAVAVEIDPLITQTVRQNMPWASAMIDSAGYDATSNAAAEETDRLGIVHADGRVYINETDQRFDAVVMDAFSSRSVPAHLATRETYERLRKIVDGPVYVNLIDAPDGRLARGIYAILSDLYPHVEAVQGPVSSRGLANTVLAASRDPIDQLEALPEDYKIAEISQGRAFTDDRGWAGHW